MDDRARHEIESRLAELLRVPRWQLREYFAETTARVRHNPNRITGIRWMRGIDGQGGCYVRDPKGTDIVPDGYEVPPPLD